MADLSREMAELDAALEARPLVGARVVLFVSLDAGAESAETARAFALARSEDARRGVWLIDLDLMQGGQTRHFQERADLYGPLGPLVRASPSSSSFFTVRPETAQDEDASFLAAQSVGPRRLWVTRFRSERLTSGQRAHIVSDGRYWRDLRAHADLIVVDAPPLARSDAWLALVQHMDDVVIVTPAARREPERVRALAEAVRHAGGRCSGVVLTGAPEEPPSFLRRLAP